MIVLHKTKCHPPRPKCCFKLFLNASVDEKDRNHAFRLLQESPRVCPHFGGLLRFTAVW